MSNNTYNGWTNRTTWAVSFWLDSDPSSFRYWCKQAQQHREQAGKCRQVCDDTGSGADAARDNLAVQLMQEVNAGAADAFNREYFNLLTDVLEEVNWSEIAAHYLALT